MLTIKFACKGCGQLISELTKPSRKDGLVTKQSLIDAAERLFTEKGINNVKLVDVSREAGQKNRTAAQYHFGNRIGLINAVLDKHTVHIARQRREMLENLDDSVSMHDLVEILVLPVVRHVQLKLNGLTYLRLNRQIVSSCEYLQLAQERSHNMPEVLELQRRIRALIPNQDEDSIHAKMILVHCMLFNGLTNYYDLKQLSTTSDVMAFVSTLCNSIEAVLMQES